MPVNESVRGGGFRWARERGARWRAREHSWVCWVSCGRRPCERTGFRLYGAAVAAAREPIFYAAPEAGGFGVPDTLDGRFDLVGLHAFLLIHRLRALPAPGTGARPGRVRRDVRRHGHQSAGNGRGRPLASASGCARCGRPSTAGRSPMRRRSRRAMRPALPRRSRAMSGAAMRRRRRRPGSPASRWPMRRVSPRPIRPRWPRAGRASLPPARRGSAA